MQSRYNEKPNLNWYDSILINIVPSIAALLIRLWMKTCRLSTIQGLEKEKDALADSNGKAIYTTWHQRMSYLFYFSSSRDVTVMISQSKDGEYAARTANRLGLKDIRGSSTRGGYRALKELARRIEKGQRGGLLADGPQGPPRIAKLGAIAMARDTGAPIIPVLWGADHCWTFNSWDRYLIPVPFTRVVVNIGDPIKVPPSAGKKEMDEFRLLLEKRMNQATDWCDQYFGKERPWYKVERGGPP